ncbi:hypothetical protein B0H14DRAFT_2634357 [Mycena olivaceomarginata]|nr:hypothetical protein B0H14DRAFT_2634357 [Mycena olivaceomarginata]
MIITTFRRYTDKISMFIISRDIGTALCWTRPLLFENLVRRLIDIHPLSYSSANDIAVKVAQMADRVAFQAEHADRCAIGGYQFCSLPGVSQQARTSVLRLVRIYDTWRLRPFDPNSDTRVVSSMQTLRSVGTSNSRFNLMGDPWQALFMLPSTRQTLSAQSIRDLLLVLSIDEDPGFGDWEQVTERSAYFVYEWFADDELRQIIEQAAPSPTLAGRWGIPEKIPLCSFPRMGCGRDKFGEEATLVMVFSALAKAWNEVDFSDLGTKQVRYCIKLLRSTVYAVFSASISKTISFVVLEKRLREPEKNGKRPVKPTILGERRAPVDTEAEWDYWMDLERKWLMDVFALRETFGKKRSTTLIRQESRDRAESVREYTSRKRCGVLGSTAERGKKEVEEKTARTPWKKHRERYNTDNIGRAGGEKQAQMSAVAFERRCWR